MKSEPFSRDKQTETAGMNGKPARRWLLPLILGLIDIALLVWIIHSVLNA